MSRYIPIISLNYLKHEKIHEYKCIKNISINFRISHLLFRRFRVNSYISLEDLVTNSNYHLYDETINSAYLKTKGLKQFLTMLFSNGLSNIS